MVRGALIRKRTRVICPGNTTADLAKMGMAGKQHELYLMVDFVFFDGRVMMDV